MSRDNVIDFNLYYDKWKTVFEAESGDVDLQIHVDTRVWAIDITMVNVEGESMAARLDVENSWALYESLRKLFEPKGGA
jgi:hypothetical protein